ncbi:MAG: FtsX-like permease family protein [Bacillota bacterium]|nr:FtsX-like permease family protein [Bacillota bacterium]
MLWRKMLRDLKENKGAYVASTIVIVIGLMVFTAFSMVLDNLKLSQQQFYNNQNFAKGFAQVAAIPAADLKRLEDVEGIETIQGRIVKDVRVLLPNREENIYLRLVSIDQMLTNPINGVLLSEGIPLSDDELQFWVDSNFFAANNLSLNDDLEIIASGRKQKLQLVGVGKSPEFIYALRTSAELYPSPETFGIAFISLNMMKHLFPQEQAFNDIVFTLKPGADFDEVKQRLEYQLQPYGLKSLFSRDDHISHMMLTEELKGLESMAIAFPTIFLSIAAMILYIMLKRMIEQQRGQIGTLKALGYTHQEIILHYLSYAVAIAFFGAIVGSLLGILISYPFTEFYQLFFNMPDLTGNLSLNYFIISIFLSLGFGLIAGYQGCKKTLTLEPAEAMRPPAPIIGGTVLLEKITFFWHMLTVQGMMAIRNLSRNKGRSAFIFVGIMFCFAISAFTWSMNDLVQKLLFDQFEKVEVYDVKVALASPHNEKSVTRELEAFPGVNQVEGLAEIPVTLKNKWYKKDVLLLGVPDNSSLYNIIDKEYRKVAPSQHGLLLSERLAALLDVEIGSSVTVEILLPSSSSQDKELIVVGTIPQYLGINAYMELAGLQSFLQQEYLVTSLMLNMEEESIPLLQEKYLLSSSIASIDSKGEQLAMLQEMMATYGSMIYIYSVIGLIIGFAIIYTTTIITLSERSRELASMMVLGMTPREVLSVITFEQWFIGMLGMIAGIPLSKVFITALSSAISNDLFTIPTNITSSAFMQAIIVTALSIWIAQQAGARKIKELSLVEVLKASE